MEFVFIRDVDPKTFDANLFIIKTFSKSSEVYIAIPFGPILGLDELLGMYIKRTPSCVQMLKDLDGLYILVVSGVKVLEL